MATLEEKPCPFWRLPYELRCEIYLLATPARIVHVKEGMVYENERDRQEARTTEHTELWFAFKQFALRLLNRPSSVDLRVHPDIAYFAHNWRYAMARASSEKPRQTALDEYGFRSSKGTHQPWTPTTETPAVPPEWLLDHPWMAFEMVRKSYLWSQAPIPPLLHMCSDSRRVLMEFGYELAFATRSHGPRTWFHFGRDRLFLEKRPMMTDNYARFYDQARYYDEALFYDEFLDRGDREHGPHSYARGREDQAHWAHWSRPFFGYAPLLSGSPWDVGPFSAADLQRIGYLVLGRGTWVGNALRRAAGDFLPLLPNLKEVWVQEWPPEILQDLLPQPQETQQVQTSSPPRELWGSIAVEEMDAVGFMYWSVKIDGVYSLHPSPASTGPFNDGYNRFKNVENEGTFYESQARELERILSQRDLPPIPLHVPRFRFVHVLPERWARQFIEERHSFWRFFDESQRAIARGEAAPPFNKADVSDPASFRLLRWNNQPDHDKWVQMLRAVKDMDVVTLMRLPWDLDGSNILSTVDKVRRLQAWYLSEVEVPEPSVDLL